MTKPISPRLLALFASAAGSNLFVANIFLFTLVDGTLLRYTDGDRDLTVNGQVYSAGVVQIGPFFGTSQGTVRASWGIGTSPNTLTFEVIPAQGTVAGASFLRACQIGVFDGATLTVSRLFMPTYGDTRRGPLRLDVYRVAEVDCGRSSAIFTINTFDELLDQQFPRNMYQAACVNNLGDTACGVNLTALAVACVVVAGSTKLILSANFAAAPAARYDLGKATFTSGTLLGFSRTIKSSAAGAPGTITLLYPFPSAPTAGDTFNIYPGCDKTLAGANGCAKFANQSRWRGEDRIPTAETSI